MISFACVAGSRNSSRFAALATITGCRTRRMRPCSRSAKGGADAAAGPRRIHTACSSTRATLAQVDKHNIEVVATVILSDGRDIATIQADPIRSSPNSSR
jgi:hypothetical protein